MSETSLGSGKNEQGKMQEKEQPHTYRLSFTFGGLLVPESRIAARQYLKSGSWEAARAEIEERKLLQKTRRSTAYRYFREIRDRLQTADPNEIEMIAKGDEDTVRLVLLVIVCRYYRLIRDLVMELAAWKFHGRDTLLERYEIDAFFEKKGEQHPELLGVSPSTKRKLVQVAIRILREARLIDAAAGKTIIQKPAVPDSILRYYAGNRNYEAFDLFLLTRSEIQKAIGE